jgi:hypothetical protein
MLGEPIGSFLKMVGAIGESYPAGWDLNFFKSMKSFAKRKSYCDARLKKRLGAGSSRIVYQIDNDKVLKLASNEKGQSQNQQEYDLYTDGLIAGKETQQLLAEIFNADEEDFNWIEVELVDRVTSEDFKSKLGIPFSEFQKIITYWGNSTAGRESEKPALWDELNHNSGRYPWWKALLDIGDNFDYALADWKRLSSWGKTGEGRMVLVDYGLSQEVYDTHYRKDKK